MRRAKYILQYVLNIILFRWHGAGQGIEITAIFQHHGLRLLGLSDRPPQGGYSTPEKQIENLWSKKMNVAASS